MPPEDSEVLLPTLEAGSATFMYAPMNHMQSEPPMAPIIRRLRRPIRSIRKRSHTIVKTVLTTPNIPVVRKPVFVPVMPMLLKTVGL